MDIDRAREINALKLSGIYTQRDERREVPGGDLAANLIGFTSPDMVGLEGLEARYDDLLHGEDGERVFEIGPRRTHPRRLQPHHPGQAGQLASCSPSTVTCSS